jgi:hypothetical protein
MAGEDSRHGGARLNFLSPDHDLMHCAAAHAVPSHLAGGKALDRIRMLDGGAQKQFSVPLPDGREVRVIVSDKNFMTHCRVQEQE